MPDDIQTFFLNFGLTMYAVSFEKTNNQALESKSDLGMQLGKRINIMSDPAFWQLALQTVQPNQLLANGYHTCDTAYPGFLQGDHVTCFCR